MRRFLFLAGFVIGVHVCNYAEAIDFRDGPPFKPTVPVAWEASGPVPQSLAVYQVVTNKLTQSLISNAMTIGSFKPINLVKTKDAGTVEFRDKPGDNDWTRFLKMSDPQGWIKYYDKTAEKIPAHGVPSVEEAENQALRYFILLGGKTNELSARPWPHNESTFETHNPSDGKLMAKGISRQWVCLFRQIDGIPITGNSLSIDFGCDAKPIMLEMNWQTLKLDAQIKVPTKDEIVELLKKGKAWIQMFPPPPEDIRPATSYKIKNFVPLYAQASEGGANLMKPYGSLLVEADVNGKPVNAVINFKIVNEQ